MELGFTIGSLAIGGFCTYVGFRNLRAAALVEDLPTSTIRAAAPGEIELKGKAQTNNPVTSPITKTPCAYYKYEELELQRVREGKHTRIKWVRVGGNEACLNLQLNDGTGSVRIDIGNAQPDVKATHIFAERAKRTFFGLIATNERLPRVEVFEKASTQKGYKIGDHKRIEYLITENKELYVLGDLKDNVVAKGEAAFIITDKTEKEITAEKRTHAYIALTIGIILLLTSAYFAFIQ